MKRMLALSWQRWVVVCGLIAACTMAASQLGAQSVAQRISSEIVNSGQVTLRGSLHPFAQARFDSGRVPANTKLNGITMVFSRSAAQQADLDALIAAQQNPASPHYHHWLTPDQFAARFGMAEADLNRVESWLGQQGFSVDSVARSRNSIRFTGTARQVEQAFSTEMHYFDVEGAQHFAPSVELSVPAALAPVVLAVRNLSDLRLKPMRVLPARPSFTSGQSQNVHFAPGDIAQVYNINPVYQAGFDGTGQSIAVVGQSAIVTSDIENFQSASNLPIKDPTLVLVPGTGSSTIFKGDESESDIDVEWSGAVARGAEIIFVYVGNFSNSGVFDSIQYAVDQNIAPIISVSYGACETEFSPATDVLPLEAIAQQGASQGQTIAASSGDSGSTSCSTFTNLTPAQQTALAVSYPASSAWVTGIGGTEITPADSVSTNSTYWETTPLNGPDILTSAKTYIPEIVWNDDVFSVAHGGGLSSSGGGPSVLIARPAWQTGVPGIPSGTERLVPDVSFYSSPDFPGYLYCSSDISTQISGSCASGFRDSANQFFTIAGGTSFGAPVFAGMVAIINQAKGYTSGQGLLNPMLYTLAADSATYASAFHDVTVGNNNCLGGTGLCINTDGFSAGVGYDQATGLGSVDMDNLIAVWPTNATPLVGTTTTISAATLTPDVNVTDTFTITVTAASGSATPTGSVNLSIDGGGTAFSNGGTTATVTLSAGSVAGTATASYQTAFATAATHQIVAQYLGDTNFALSTSVVQLVVGGGTGTGSIAISASNTSASSPTLTVSQGGSGIETLTITPSGGYTGTVLLSYTTSNSTALTNLCVFAQTVVNGSATVLVPGINPVQTSITLDTLPSDCGLARQPAGGKSFHRLLPGKTAENKGTNSAPLGVAFAGLLLAGFLGRYSRKFHKMAGLIALVAVGLAVTSCGGGGGGSSTPPPTSDPPKGTYTITITGQDSATSTITSQTAFTFIIQ